MTGAPRPAPPHQLGRCQLTWNDSERRWRAECMVFGAVLLASERPSVCPYCRRSWQRDREAQLSSTRG